MKKVVYIIFTFLAVSYTNTAFAEIYIDADEQIEFYQNDGKVIAIGNAKIRKDDQTIEADKITGFYEDKNNNKLNIDKIIAEGNVKINTKDIIATANRSEYLPKEDIVKLFDKVTISQNGNTITGDYAETNIKTGISKLVSKKTGGRVSGVFKEKN